MNRNVLLNILILFLLFSQVTLVSTQPILRSSHQDQQQKTSINLISSHQQIKHNLESFFNHPGLLSVLNKNPSSTSFQPENLTFSDDAYHGSNQTYSTEWWYFDATLNQEYTIQFGIHIHHIITMGIATIHCNIYHKGQSIINERLVQPLSTLRLSSQKPFISINNKIIMQGQQKENGKPDTYQIIYSGDDYAFDLTYKGITYGWKGNTAAGDWAVVFPKAMVQGSLTIQNTTIKSSGIGYHDHNWNVTASTGLNFGWLWGKTSISNYTLTWANIFETWYKGSPLLVINKDYNGYTNVPANNLYFSVINVSFKNGMLVPTGFLLSGKLQNYNFSLKITVLNSDYITVLGLINYWRYHIHITGSFTVNDQKETVDDYNIAEFIRFRPY
ncbi:MAG TPA: hypothetical protein VKP59_02100 [Candidatus Thermoplasmatota archaeon]|nr:hypothetical protein [Candidatus Thermoplasmatota archaeon]